MVNNYTTYYENKTSWITTPVSLDFTSGIYNIQPCQLYSGIIHINSAVAGTNLVFPSSADLCNELKGKLLKTTQIEFPFIILNGSNQTMTLNFAVDPDIYNRWTGDTTNINIPPGETASFLLYLQNCVSGTEQYYVIRSPDYTSNI